MESIRVLHWRCLRYGLDILINAWVRIYVHLTPELIQRSWLHTAKRIEDLTVAKGYIIEYARLFVVSKYIKIKLYYLGIMHKMPSNIVSTTGFCAVIGFRAEVR
jgi:hypothetical protein